MDMISRQAAIAVADSSDYVGLSVEDVKKVTDEVVKGLKRLPSEQPEHTETHSCDYERTGTHDWIPVTERQPNHELAIVQFSDGDFSLLQFPTAYRWKDIVAWFPLPEPYKEGQEC